MLLRHLLFATSLVLFATSLGAMPATAHAGDSPRLKPSRLAITDFAYVDTSGEARDQRAEHDARLDRFMQALRHDFARAGFSLVTPTCHPAPCMEGREPIQDVVADARTAGAGILVMGGIHKMSTLVQWARVTAIDTRTGRVALDKLFTFRGDTDEAWRQAEAFVFSEIAPLSPS